MFGLFKRKGQEVISAPLDPVEARYAGAPAPTGYEEFWCIESPYTTIRFAVPSDAWKKLGTSKEWKDFEALLRKHQI